MKEKFGTAISCMDGRIQLPVINYLKAKFGIDFVDIITELGPNKQLSEGTDLQAIERIKRCLAISMEKHGSKFVILSAHHDCAGNPEEKEIQLKQLLSSIELIKSWNLDVKIIGLWIDEQWKANEISLE